MQYTEVIFTIKPVEPARSLLVDALGNNGPYDSFEETANGLKAYVPTNMFDEDWLKSQIEALRQILSFDFHYSAEALPDKNWNEEWEKNHTPVLVETASRIYIRAPFHESRSDVDYEIVIEPKMSFGTAHHQTTRMMLSFVSEEPLQGRSLLDMGSGTGVLAILAKMRGAAYVEAVDVDEWAYRNAVENADRNGVEINPRLGDATTLAGCFDVVLANINRNILLRDMEAYAAVLNTGGSLIMSGFYEHDVESVTARALELGLRQSGCKSDDGWAALKFTK